MKPLAPLVLLAFAGASAAQAGFVEVVDWEYRDASTGLGLTLIEPGGEVVWRVSQGIHTVRETTSDFASGVLFEGDEFRVRIEGEGVTTYYCEFHEWMRGVIVSG